ncbi:MAG: branched-chain amino acid ABC transporter permease [Planctomycetota bacterium]
MISRLKNSFLIAVWVLVITFPLLGLKTTLVGTGRVLSFRSDAFWIAGIVFACGIIWAFKDRIGKGLHLMTVPFRPIGQALKSGLSKIPAWLWILSLVIILLGFPMSGPEHDLNKYFSFLIDTFIYVGLALGLNIVVGMTGLLVLGYAAFFAIGAYTYAIFSMNFQVPFWACLIFGSVNAGIIGILLGIPSIRLRGDYLAIVTLGFGEVVRFVLKNETAVTGGEQGLILNPPTIASFEISRPIHYYYIALVMMALVIFVVHRLNHSRIGRAWIALREDETAAMVMGINTFKMKILAFALSAAVAGFMGVFYAARMNFVNPEAFRFEYSVLILSMVILGGMGSVPGVILGAAILQFIPWMLRDLVPNLLREQFPSAVGLASRLTDFRLLIFSGIIILMMIFRPQGIVGSVRRKIELGLTKDNE